MLKVNNIEVVYNDIILALRGISLQVPEKSIIALLGVTEQANQPPSKPLQVFFRWKMGRLRGE